VVFLLFLGSLLVACGGTRDYEEFSHRDPYMKKDDFYRDVRVCETEKSRHSSKIQGREMGFKGQDTGFLGCMKLKGWEKIQP
jgi:hypothetical protein